MANMMWTALKRVAALGLFAAVGLAGTEARAEEAPVTLEAVTVTARLRQEDVQDVPGAVSVIGDQLLKATRSDNIAQIAQLVPSVNYSSPNPRNTSLTIRGLGSSVVAIAQSNDGLEPGVGFYVDQVYHARPASAAFDFLDVERVEVLRGPQGTLFGKNTTAGAVNITTRAPLFEFAARGELALGNFNYRQAKLSLTGPLWADALAGSLSLVTTRRDGVITNVRTGAPVNDVDSMAIHAQLLFQPNDHFSLRLSADDASINSNCCTQVYVRVGHSLRPAERQFPTLAAGVGYGPPSLNPYARLSDIDAPVEVNTDDAGYSAVAEWDLGQSTITSVTAWRWWNWDAANDRDYTSQRIQLLQHIPSRQDQYSQEMRIASKGRQTLEYVAGIYGFKQVITGQPITVYGPDAAYWLLGAAPTIPSDLLSGYTQDGHTRFRSQSYAAFGELTWRITERLNVTGGLRYTAERKDGRYSTTVSGGPNVLDALRDRQLSILRPQSYAAEDTDSGFSGRATVSYDLTDSAMVYGNFARAYKSGGINMSGLPLDTANNPALATAVVRPEKDTTYELGIKSELFNDRLTLNADIFDTVVRDFQANVVDTGPGALRGYLANVEKVKVKGLEIDGRFVVSEHLSGHIAHSQTQGRYVSYRNGPCPLEVIRSSTAVCDLSGRDLPNLPRFVWSAGGEYKRPLTLNRLQGELYLHGELTARTRSFGDPTASQFTVIEGYRVVNASLGFRMHKGWEISLWARNLFNLDYMQNLTVQAGNSGLIVGTPSDPRSIGITLGGRY